MSGGVIFTTDMLEQFMSSAMAVSKDSVCLSEPKGAVVVSRSGEIIGRGSCGAPKVITSCLSKMLCHKRALGFEHGTGHEACFSVHAEISAILDAMHNGYDVLGCTLVCTHKPCVPCTCLIIEAGIFAVHFKFQYPSDYTDELFNEAGIPCVCL